MIEEFRRELNQALAKAKREGFEVLSTNAIENPPGVVVATLYLDEAPGGNAYTYLLVYYAQQAQLIVVDEWSTAGLMSLEKWRVSSTGQSLLYWVSLPTHASPSLRNLPENTQRYIYQYNLRHRNLRMKEVQEDRWKQVGAQPRQLSDYLDHKYRWSE